METLKILLADDHAVVRQGVKQILIESFPRATFGDAQSTHELLQLILRERWDIVVLDLSMHGSNALDALKQIKHERPELPVLILSTYPEDQYAVRTLRAGASGYLNKECAPEELVQALRRILQGKKYISASVGEELEFELHRKRADGRPLHADLSDREYQVLCMLASGKKVSEIAIELALSPKTISTYRARVLQKMHLQTNAELARYARQHDCI